MTSHDSETPAEPRAESIGHLRDVLGFRIRLAHGAVYRHFTESFAELDLTQKQVSALWLVDDHPGIAQTGIAARMRMDRATTMGIVNKLQARGFLVRLPSPSDGRKQALELTAAGRAALAQARDAVERHEHWLRARFTPREAETLARLLQRIYE